MAYLTSPLPFSMKRTLFFPLNVLTVLFFFNGFLQAGELPSPIATSLSQIAAAALPTEVTPFEDAGEALYLVEVQIPGNPERREWHFDAQGVPVGVQAFQTELPQSVRDALAPHLNRNGAQLSDTVKIFESGTALFEVEINEGKESKSLGFYPDGRPAYTETDQSALPKPVKKAIHRLTQTEGTLESILSLQGKGRELYQLTVARPQKPLWLTVDASGAVVEREETVEFKAVPESVQKAILAKIGSAAQLRILFKEVGKTPEFEVHAFRGAKLHFFRFSPSGEPLPFPTEPLSLP